MPRSGTFESAPIFTYLSKYASGCYLPHRWFPRRTLSGNLVNTLLGCRLRVDQEALSDTAMDPSPLADPIHESTGEVFLRRGVLKRTCVDRLVARISVQLLDHLTCLLIAAPQVARCRARFANPVVGHSEVGVERLSRRTGCASSSRMRRLTRGPLEAHAQQIRRVDNRLPLKALHVVKGLADSAAMDRHDHGFGVRDVPALSPGPRHLVARPLPEISERATAIAIAYHCHVHFTSCSSLESRAQLVVPTTPAY